MVTRPLFAGGRYVKHRGKLVPRFYGILQGHWVGPRRHVVICSRRTFRLCIKGLYIT